MSSENGTDQVRRAAEQPIRKERFGVLLALLLAGAALGWAGYSIGAKKHNASSPLIARDSASVVHAVRHVAKLESTVFHMERVIDLYRETEGPFNLLKGKDSILLIAVADIRAGIDLEKIRPEDITVNHTKSQVELRLPPPEILSATLDTGKTYVHSQSRSLWSKKQQSLETEARQYAERQLSNAAIKAGILSHARQQAAIILRGLLRELGFQTVLVKWQNDENDLI